MFVHRGAGIPSWAPAGQDQAPSSGQVKLDTLLVPALGLLVVPGCIQQSRRGPSFECGDRRTLIVQFQVQAFLQRRQ